MRRYYFICLGVVAILVAMTLSYRSEPTKFFGIADTKETIVNFEEGVEIQKLYVVEGQAVNPGDTLVILEQPELMIRINEIENTLNESKAQKKYDFKINEGERQRYIAEAEEKKREITTEIRELEAQYATNINLVKTLRSLNKEKDLIADIADSSNTILAQIKGLKLQLDAAQNTLQVHKNRFTNLTTADNPVQALIQRYTRELELLKQQQQQLVKRAPISGMIGMVKFKEGERVSPFDTILTLHTTAPSYVRGYIHENVYSRVKAGDTVIVKSFADEKQAFNGKVVGVGSRIVDYPLRLRSRQEIPIWGREVLIKIPDDNSFLLGEKVLISVLDKKKRWVFPLIPAHMVGK